MVEVRVMNDGRGFDPPRRPAALAAVLDTRDDWRDLYTREWLIEDLAGAIGLDAEGRRERAAVLRDDADCVIDGDPVTIALVHSWGSLQHYVDVVSWYADLLEDDVLRARVVGLLSDEEWGELHERLSLV
jgi:hypothetical protein